jgi:pimeloyl-ACP methyl ester carboxylesterase
VQLFTREWGSGERRAVLVHGAMSDSRTWHRLGPALAARGFHVTAVDLRGHGRSPRAAEYTPALFADDLVESVAARPDLVIGHSLGGLALGLALDRLQPRRAVFIDPAWTWPGFGRLHRLVVAPTTWLVVHAPRPVLRLQYPRWDAQDVTIEIEGRRAFDPAVARRLHAVGDAAAPAAMVVPSLVVTAARSEFVPPLLVERLRALGFEVHVDPSAGHAVHREHLPALLALLDRWL